MCQLRRTHGRRDQQDRRRDEGAGGIHDLETTDNIDPILDEAQKIITSFEDDCVIAGR